MFLIRHALPAMGMLPSSPIIEEGRSLHTWEIGGMLENVSNDVIMSHKLGHCDLFSYISLIKVIYNSHNQFYIFLFFVVPKKSIFLKISGFHMFLQNMVFFRFSYRAQTGTRYFFLSNNYSYHTCWYVEIKLLVPGALIVKYPFKVFKMHQFRQKCSRCPSFTLQCTPMMQNLTFAWT